MSGPVEEAGGGGVEAVGGVNEAVRRPAEVHGVAHLARQHLAQLHAPLVETVDAPHEALDVHNKSLCLILVIKVAENHIQGYGR